MPRNRSEADPAAHLPEAMRAYAHMVARKDRMPEGSPERENAVDGLLSHWDNEMSADECLEFSRLPRNERIAMFIDIKMLMAEGKLT